VIEDRALHVGLPLEDVDIVDHSESPDIAAFSEELYRIGCRDGYTLKKADRHVRTPLRYGVMMLRMGKADAMIAGVEDAYSDTLRRVLPLTETCEGIERAAGFNLLLIEGQVYVIGDTTLNIDPNSSELADIALLGARLAADLGMTPRVAMLSFSNFGDNRHPRAAKVRDAVAILRREQPDLIVDGEMHGDVAVLPAFAKANFPHSRIQGDANVLICPDLDSANIVYKLVVTMGQGREAIGPLLEGLKHPVTVVSFNSTAREIANLAALSCYRACKV
jgi:malate dehydrogenase (oxaloacetate-decarboxylating)(NADP+)